jgi:hypothetical protein
VAELWLGGVKISDDVIIEFKVNFEHFNQAMSYATRVLVDFEDVVRCEEHCKCGLWRCTGTNPHAPRFGPFHVYPQHPCDDLADPRAALDRAAEEADPDRPTSLEEFYHRLGIGASPSTLPESDEKESAPTDDHDSATPKST